MSQYIQHPSHGHILTSSYLPFGYRCNVCLEDGIGRSYRCHACDFDVHPFCASAPPLLHTPFHNHSDQLLAFNPRPPGQNSRHCSACRNSVEGFGYACPWGSCGYVLHPSCAQLPGCIWLPNPMGEQMLRLCPSLTSACCWCGQSDSGWAYAPISAWAVEQWGSGWPYATPSAWAVGQWGSGWPYAPPFRTYNIHVRCVKRVMDSLRPSMQLGGHAGEAGNHTFNGAIQIISQATIHAIVGSLISSLFNN